MFHAYYSSIVGTKHDICEDYSKKAILDDCLITVIADGVGSAKLSDVGSKIIVETLISTFFNGYSNSLSEIDALKLLKESYVSAYNTIINKANNENEDKYSYDSTLSCIVITANYIIWGHSGDGAIFKINSSGFMTKLTCEQVGDFSGEVYAFLSGEKYWSFGQTSLANSYAFIMSTDGILEFLNLVLSDPNDKFIFKIFQQLQKRNFDDDVCNDFVKQILNLKAICNVTHDDKTLAIVVNDEISLKPNRHNPNPIVYSGTNSYFINYEDNEYLTDVKDVIDINIHNLIIKEENSNMVTNIPYSNKVNLLQVIYPLRDVEIVLDLHEGIKIAIQLVQYIISRILYNYHTIFKEIKNTQSFFENGLYKYFDSTEDNIHINQFKKKFLLDNLDDFQSIIISIYLFRDYFMFDIKIPDEIKLDMEFQMWSYSYAFANALIKAMRSIAKHINSIPKPKTNFKIVLQDNNSKDK